MMLKMQLIRIDGEETYAIQFHPEVYHSTDGKQLLENFLVSILLDFIKIGHQILLLKKPLMPLKKK